MQKTEEAISGYIRAINNMTYQFMGNQTCACL